MTLTKYDAQGRVIIPVGSGGGGGLVDGDYGDITISGAGTVLTIDAASVTGAKLAASAIALFESAGAITTHVGLADPHTQYLLVAEANALYSILGHTHAQADITGLVAALAAKEGTITAGGVGDYWRGDKTFQTLNKTAVGLANVDNTTDLLKPISTATQTALDLKAPLASPTFTGTVGGITKAMVGLANVDNTSDANKPVSTAQATAIGLKLDATHAGSGGTAHANVIAGGAAGFMIGADKTKLDGVATGATANAADAFLLARANHTGTQTASTISDLIEVIQDMLGTGFIVQGANMTITYDDVANTLTFAAAGGGGGGGFTYPQVQSMLSLGR